MPRSAQVRRKMVQGVRDTIATLSSFQPGADVGTLEEKLIKTFVELLDNVLIELEYSYAILPHTVRPAHLDKLQEPYHLPRGCAAKELQERPPGADMRRRGVRWAVRPTAARQEPASNASARQQRAAVTWLRMALPDIPPAGGSHTWHSTAGGTECSSRGGC